MADDAAAWEYRVFTRLTAIKLANQMLDRQSGLSAYQRRLVQTALQAADELTADLLSNLPPGECGIAPTRLHPEWQDDRTEQLG